MLEDIFTALKAVSHLNKYDLPECSRRLSELLAKRYAMLWLAMFAQVRGRLIQPNDNKGKTPRSGRLVSVGQYGSPGNMTVELKFLVDGEERPRLVRLPQSALENANLQLAVRHEGTTIFIDF